MKHLTSLLLIMMTFAQTAVFAESTASADIIPPSITMTTQYPGVVIENGVLKKVPKDFKGTFVIGSEVTAIGFEAFTGCIGLTSVTIPNSVTSIDANAFRATGLTSVTIPNSVTTIGDYAFYDCPNLSHPIIHDTIFVALPMSHQGAYTVPSGIKKIIGGAFQGCTGLTVLTIPESVSNIGPAAFMDCESLTSVNIPDSVRRFGPWIFDGCKSLTSVTIPDSMTIIEWHAFRRCSSLTSVTIPKGVTSIGWCAFEKCSALTTVTIQGSSTDLDSENKKVFDYCPKLKRIYVPRGSKEHYKSMLPKDLQSKVKEQ